MGRCVWTCLGNEWSGQGEVDVEGVGVEDGRPEAEDRERRPAQHLDGEAPAAELKERLALVGSS